MTLRALSPRSIRGTTAFATVALVVASTAAACEAPGSNDNPPAYGATASEGGGPIVDSGSDVSSGPVALPMIVSNEFQPTGFMGDSMDDSAAVTLSSNPTQCLTPRVSGAAGECFSLSWTPVTSAGGWAGIYWQYPADNWGTQQGIAIAPGATKVTFAAAGANGGEVVQFIAGGINTTPQPDAGLSFNDSFRAATTVMLTKEWQTFTIPLTGDTYKDVLGGFAWTVAASSMTTTTFYLDNIQWEP